MLDIWQVIESCDDVATLRVIEGPTPRDCAHWYHWNHKTDAERFAYAKRNLIEQSNSEHRARMWENRCDEWRVAATISRLQAMFPKLVPQ